MKDHLSLTVRHYSKILQYYFSRILCQRRVLERSKRVGRNHCSLHNKYYCAKLAL